MKQKWHVALHHAGIRHKHMIMDEDGAEVAVVKLSTPKRALLHAYLIAAAPELLLAAQTALASLEAANEVMGGGTESGGPEYYEQPRKFLQQAIKKAMGDDDA